MGFGDQALIDLGPSLAENPILRDVYGVYGSFSKTILGDILIGSLSLEKMLIVAKF